MNDAAQAQSACPVRFVPQAMLPAGQAYEAFVFSTGQVPTRDGLHDFFNDLCWLHFPRSKQRLNQLQAAHIAHQAPDALWEALQAKDWVQLFGPLRPLWGQAQLLLFGHALLEKLVHPRKAITAHVYRLPPCAPDVAAMDAALCNSLDARTLAAKPFAHLPVLGVPGWWAANEDPAFYADSAVFRAPRSARARG